MRELKPCKCGSDEICPFHYKGVDFSNIYEVGCNGCGLETCGRYSTKEESIKAWNGEYEDIMDRQSELNIDELHKRVLLLEEQMYDIERVNIEMKTNEREVIRGRCISDGGKFPYFSLKHKCGVCGKLWNDSDVTPNCEGVRGPGQDK